MIQDHRPVPLSNFKGLYDRSRHKDDVREGYLIDGLNIFDYGEDIGTRKGFTKTITFPAIRRQKIWQVAGQADRTLVLDTDGLLFDTTASLSTPIYNFGSSVTDFSIISYNGRCYITPHNGETGESGRVLLVYTGSGLARPAAGLKPPTGSNAVVSTTAGNIEEGVHIFAWAFETDTGFITPPSDRDDFNQLDFIGGQTVDFTSIPVGPTGTAARRLLATRSLQHPIFDKEDYEYFLVPSGRIANNTDTTLNGVSFFDSELRSSADYLFDELEEIPAGVFLSPYGTRIIIGGESANPSMARISKLLEPESFDALNGFIVIGPHEDRGLKNGIEFRKAFYIFKGNPGHTYITQDNGYEPSTWPLDSIDKGIGADCHAISQYIESKGANSDFFLVGDVAGIFRFDGSYNQQVPLTFTIQKIWDRINKDAFNKVELFIDSKRFLIYVTLPLNTVDEEGEILTTAISPNHILVGNYTNGLWPDKIKWHLWSSVEFAPRSIAIEIDSATKTTQLKVAGALGNIYKYDQNIRHDEEEGIDSFAQFEYVKLIPNHIHHYGGVGLNIKGNGILDIRGYITNLVSFVTVPPLTLEANPGREYFKLMNLQNEKCSIRLSVNQANSYFILQQMNVYVNDVFATRPG